jgi:hypothetical protein
VRSLSGKAPLAKASARPILAQLLNGAPDALLNTYQAERLPTA